MVAAADAAGRAAGGGGCCLFFAKCLFVFPLTDFNKANRLNSSAERLAAHNYKCQTAAK